MSSLCYILWIFINLIGNCKSCSISLLKNFISCIVNFFALCKEVIIFLHYVTQNTTVFQKIMFITKPKDLVNFVYIFLVSFLNSIFLVFPFLFSFLHGTIVFFICLVVFMYVCMLFITYVFHLSPCISGRCVLLSTKVLLL